MPKPSRKTIEPLLEEWARLQTRAIDIELKRDRDLQPLKETYEKKSAVVITDASARLTPVLARMAVLAGEIQTQMKSGVDEKTARIALSQVSLDFETTKSIANAVAAANKAEAETLRESEDGKPLVTALAEVQVKESAREIDPQKLFKHVPENKRGAGFWAMLKVLIAPAVKELGDNEVDKLATKTKSYNVAVTLNPATAPQAQKKAA